MRRAPVIGDEHLSRSGTQSLEQSEPASELSHSNHPQSLLYMYSPPAWGLPTGSSTHQPHAYSALQFKGLSPPKHNLDLQNYISRWINFPDLTVLCLTWISLLSFRFTPNVEWSNISRPSLSLVSSSAYCLFSCLFVHRVTLLTYLSTVNKINAGGDNSVFCPLAHVRH